MAARPEARRPNLLSASSVRWPRAPRVEDPQLPAIAAISAAARHRVRAIFLTTITTVMGLMPMLFDKSEVIQFLVPMVISLGAGLVFASLGVLFLVPAVVIIGEMVRVLPVFAALSGVGKARVQPN